MSAEKFEAFLAKLYADEKARSRFLVDPRRESLNAGLTENDSAALENIDLVGLELASHSITKKKAACPPKKPVLNLARWFRRR
jgi:hypothetical protein